MATNLRWNVVEDAQQEAQRRADLAPRLKAEADRRAAMKRDIPIWEQYIATAEANLTTARAELVEREREEGEAQATWVWAYHRDSGGSTPRTPDGRLILFTPMEGMHPEALASIPARGEWERFKEAEQRAIRARAKVHKIEAALVEQRAALETCRNA